jgi:hypothetical protein
MSGTGRARLGDWEPQGIEERLDRMESLAAIRQLAYRYGLCLDSRDMATMASLFVPDVQVGRDESGRAALQAWFAETMSAMHISIHLVANHIIDFDDADHARGIVYCRDELEYPASGRWEIGVLQYWDRYVRVDGEWCFARRKFHRWYIDDALSRPSAGAGLVSNQQTLSTTQLPHAFTTWAQYWAEIDRSRR